MLLPFPQRQLLLQPLYLIYLLLLLQLTSHVHATIYMGFPFNEQLPNVARVNEAYTFTFAKSTYKSTSEGGSDNIQYNVTSLPSWLSFDSESRTFTGTPDSSDEGEFQITLVGVDQLDDSSMENSYSMVVSSLPNLDSNNFNLYDELTSMGQTNGGDGLVLKQGDEFSFTFPKIDDAVAYYGRSSDRTSLPNWVKFSGNTFSGTVPYATLENSPSQAFNLNYIATDIAGYAAVVKTFEILVGGHQLSTDLKDAIEIEGYKNEEVEEEVPLSHVFLDGAKIAKENISSVIGDDLPVYLELDTTDYTISGTLPNDESEGSNSTTFNVQIEDIYGNKVQIPYSVRISKETSLSSIYESSYTASSSYSSSTTSSSSSLSRSLTTSSVSASATSSSSTAETSSAAAATATIHNKSSNNNLAIGLGVGLGVGIPLLALLILGLCCCCRRRKNKDKTASASTAAGAAGSVGAGAGAAAAAADMEKGTYDDASPGSNYTATSTSFAPLTQLTPASISQLNLMKLEKSAAANDSDLSLSSLTTHVNDEDQQLQQQQQQQQQKHLDSQGQQQQPVVTSWRADAKTDNKEVTSQAQDPLRFSTATTSTVNTDNLFTVRLVDDNNGDNSARLSNQVYSRQSGNTSKTASQLMLVPEANLVEFTTRRGSLRDSSFEPDHVHMEERASFHLNDDSV